MQFKLDANQEYQVRGIEAVTTLLEGQPRIGPCSARGGPPPAGGGGKETGYRRRIGV